MARTAAIHRFFHRLWITFGCPQVFPQAGRSCPQVRGVLHRVVHRLPVDEGVENCCPHGCPQRLSGCPQFPQVCPQVCPQAQILEAVVVHRAGENPVDNEPGPVE